MDLALADKVVLVTGASGGIGRAMARTFAAEGARLVLQGHRQWEGMVDWLAGEPWNERALPVQADVTDPDQMRAAVQAGREQFGRVDVCVANAGVWPPDDLPLHELEVGVGLDDPLRHLARVLLQVLHQVLALLDREQAEGQHSDGHHHEKSSTADAHPNQRVKALTRGSRLCAVVHCHPPKSL